MSTALDGAGRPAPHSGVRIVGTPNRLLPDRSVRVVPPRRESISEGRSGWRSWLIPGWPLKFLLLGFPLWWVLGLYTFIFPALAVPMALDLRRRRPLRFPPAFWMWAMFLVWQVMSLAMFNQSPPGTHASGAANRIISLAFSEVLYAGVTVTLLYVVNLPTLEVPQTAIARWMGGFFLTVVAGGFLGVLFPRFSFPSALELLLPHRFTDSAYVRVLVHPVASQIQAVLGTAGGRPAAPFGYTNDWGTAVGLLVTWFVAASVIPARGSKRLLYGGVAAAVIVPTVMSLNRGLWIGLLFLAVWLTGRQVAQGRIGVLFAALAVCLAAVAVVQATALNSVISHRFDNGPSNSIRGFVAQKSITAIEHSPILGYGGNRHADGSYSSIAVGPTANCSKCGSVPTGSTGQLWSVMFDQGVPGVIFYFGFFAACLWVYRREQGALNEAALASVALVFVFMWFYIAVPAAPTITMIGVGMLYRSRAERRSAAAAAGEPHVA